MAATIGGDKVQMTSIITSPAADPHEYEAGTRSQLSLAEANLVIEHETGVDLTTQVDPYRKFVSPRGQLLNQSPELRDC